MEQEDDGAVKKWRLDTADDVMTVTEKLTAMAEAEEEEEDYIGIQEEAVVEVMKCLEKEILVTSSPAMVKGMETSLGYYQETPFVTINGNEESCGPSFSNSASTMMASVHAATLVPANWPWIAGAPAKETATLTEKDVEVQVEDEEWMEWVLGVPAVEV